MTLSLEDALWNAVLFTDRKSHVGDAIRVDEGVVTGSDDHVIIRSTWSDTGWQPGSPGFPTIKQAKTFLKEGLMDGGWTTTPPNDSIWKKMDEILDFPVWSAYPRGEEAFALRPERFAKFSRVRSGGDYPVDFYPVYNDVQEREFLYFKMGPHILGVVAPVLRGSLREEFADEPEVLW